MEMPHRLLRLPAMVLAVASVLAIAAPAAAHLHGLIPGKAAARIRDRVDILLFFGHPFEAETVEMARPEKFEARWPDGTVTDLLPTLTAEKARDPAGKEVTRFRSSFPARERGDVVLSMASAIRPEGDGFARDFARAVVHVQAEKGWDRPAGEALEVVPLTRPYGLRPGAIFLARALHKGSPLEGAEAEVERYNPVPALPLPPGEFITRTARTGPGGLIAFDLDAPGWWAISVVHEAGSHTQGGKTGPLALRATFWVFVGELLE